jgi:PhoH-like ATPase
MKNYILDTNVLLTDPIAFLKFPHNKVIIPTVVIQEIDSKKRLMDELGKNARFFCKLIDEYAQNGSLTEGIELENNSILYVMECPRSSSVYNKFDDFSKDSMIVALGNKISEETYHAGEEVVVVSKDVLVRIKSNICLLASQDYVYDYVLEDGDEKYTGYTEKYVDPDDINNFYLKKKLQWEEKNENHFFLLKSYDTSQSAIARYKENKLIPLYNLQEEVWGIYPKNVEQKMAFEVLLDPSVTLVTLSGKAGTGKTLLALASALKQVMDDSRYTKLLVARPVIPMGKDIGFLPGEMQDKLRPWMQPIYDNLEFLFNCKTRNDLDKILIGMQKEIEVEALTYIRGRSIPNQFIIIDEAQNLSKHEIKTILTRVGNGSKIVLIGDPDQIDHPYLDSYSNGLTYVIETLKHLNETAHVTLKRGERSTLAQICADLL